MAAGQAKVKAGVSAIMDPFSKALTMGFIKPGKKKGSQGCPCSATNANLTCG